MEGALHEWPSVLKSGPIESVEMSNVTGNGTERHITSIQSRPYHLARLPIIFARHYYSRLI